MENPYSPGTSAHSLFAEANKLGHKPEETDEVARAIDRQTVAMYEVGAALTQAISAISPK